MPRGWRTWFGNRTLPSEDELLEQEYRRQLEGMPERAPDPTPPSYQSPEIEDEVINARMGEVSPQVMAELRRRYKQIGTMGPEDQGPPIRGKDRRRMRRKTGGIIEGDIEGKRYRYDVYDPFVKEGFEPSRGAPKWYNMLRYTLERSQPGMHQDARDAAMQRQSFEQRARQAERAFEADEAGRKYGSARDVYQDQLRALDIQNEREMRAYEIAQRTRDSEADRASRERIANIAAGRGAQLDPLEQLEHEYLQDLKKNDPEAFAELMGNRMTRGRTGGVVKPPLTRSQAYDHEQKLVPLITELDEMIQRVEDEVTGKGFWNRAGNEDVEIYIGGKPVKIPADRLEVELKNLKARRAFYNRQRMRMRNYIDTSEWTEEGVPFSGEPNDPYKDFENWTYDRGLSPGGKPGANAVPGTGPPPSRAQTRPYGRGPEERPVIPSAEELEQLTASMDPAQGYWWRVFYALAQEAPELSNEDLVRLTDEHVQRKQAPQSMGEKHPTSSIFGQGGPGLP